MATTRDNLTQLYTPIYDEFMLAEYAEETQICKVLYQEIMDYTQTYLYDDLTGLGFWEEATEGSGGGFVDPTQGYPKTYTQTKFWQKFQVSFEAVDHDEYALLKKEGEARSMGRGARAKVERDTANHISNGFTVAGPDGQFWFDTDHDKNRDETSTDFDNLLTGPFSHDNLEAAETQITNNFFGPDGIPIMPTEDPVLLYPPALRGVVARVLDERAVNQPDTTMRNHNRFQGRYRPVEWRFLANTLGGSDSAWFIIYPELNFLKIIWSAKPHFTSWVDEDTEFYKFKGRLLYDFGHCNWRAGFGSTGL